jgi:hypothetical protein
VTESAEYDVAISFLSSDEGLALNLSEQLKENLSVFVYSERQKKIVGTDGLETFRQVFLSKSRIVVVLYRQGYGTTKWTTVEQDAIKERAFDTGWDFLLFVTLDQSPVPPWVPKTNLRLDYTKYGDQLVGAIKLRVQDAGGHLKVETALDKAQRIRATEEAKAEREMKMTHEAVAATMREWVLLCQQLSEKAEAIAKTIRLDYGKGDCLFNLHTDAGSISLARSVAYSCDFKIRLNTFIGRIQLPTDQGPRFYLDGGPQKVSEYTFLVDYNAARGWCWRLDGTKERLLTTDALSEFLMQTLLQLHQDVESGKVQRRTPARETRGRPWS